MAHVASVLFECEQIEASRKTNEGAEEWGIHSIAIPLVTFLHPKREADRSCSTGTLAVLCGLESSFPFTERVFPPPPLESADSRSENFGLAVDFICMNSV